MLTVLESLKLSTEFLERKGIDSPRLNAELLLSEIMNCKRLDLYMKFDRPLEDSVITQYREWISRRGKFEPLQYIIGKVEFYGIDLKVSPDVLIPRPETEILVETIINRNKDKRGLKVLDIGAGSGNIAVSLALNLSGSMVTGIDISEKALKIAEENSIAHGTQGNLQLVHGDINTVSFNELFDLIVSNPPYVSSDEYSTLQQEIVKYEPSNAVTDMNDGLEFYRVISNRADSLLAKGGVIYFEVGKDQAETVKAMLSEAGFINIESLTDYESIERIVTGELQ